MILLDLFLTFLLIGAVSFGGGRFNRRLVLFQICFRHSAVIIEGRCRFSNRHAQIFHARQGVFGL